MRRRLSLALACSLGAALLAAAPALAASNIYMVAGTGDGAGATCQPYPSYTTAFRCDSLRAAVAAANVDSDFDYVYLQAAGTYQLTQPPALQITSSISITGRGPRTTGVQGNGSARVFEVAPGAEALFFRFKVAGGRAGSGMGGDILNSGDLILYNMWLRDGSANAGGGLANVYPGSATLTGSLVEGNSATSQGGGLLNDGGGEGADLNLLGTTVAFNTIPNGGIGGGIATRNSASNSTQLLGVTLAHNSVVSGSGTGVGIGSVAGNGGSISAQGTIFAANFSTSAQLNCNVTVSEVSPNSNIDDATTCGLPRSSQANIQLASALSDQGGDTDVLTIPAGSSAKSIVAPCVSSVDQRDAPRASSDTCDAGAFEQGAVAPPIDSSAPLDPVFQPPPPPPPPPPPAATPTPVPTPVAGKTVVAREVSGKIRVKLPGTNTFVDVDGTQGIPVGSTVDTKDGRLELTAVQKPGAKQEKGQFYDGVFKITQTKTTTDLTLNEPLAKCGKGAGAAAKKPKTRKLWGDGSGSFRTRGQYSAATVRGTRWLVQDSCSGTLTQVKKGVVSVRDEVKRKTILLKAGKSYLARPRR